MIARYKNAITRDQDGVFYIAGAAVPTESERLDMQSRLTEIREGSTSARASIGELKVCLARLFLMFPAVYWTDEKAKATMDVYAPALVAFPLWAIERAFVKVIESGYKKPPSTPEFRETVLAEYSFAIEEANAIDLVLGARIRKRESAEERAAAKKIAKSLLDELEGRSNAREEAEAAVASGFAHLGGAPTLGDALRKALKRSATSL